MAIPLTPRVRNVVPSARPPQLEFLSGWKDIANYLGKGVRTVQRYEREFRLPIRRTAGMLKGSVIARKSDLDRWVFGLDRRRLPSYYRHSRKIRADFLRIDSEIGLTFSSMALGSSNVERKRRTIRYARQAYDSILHLRKGVELNDVERDRLDGNVKRLKSELQSLGQTF